MKNIDTTKYNRIEDNINNGKENSYILENISLYSKVDNIKIPTSNLFYEKYRGLILNNCVKVKIPENALKKYRYRPKLLSYELYGTVDLWYLLLWINNMYTTTQFNQQSIYIFNPKNISVLIRIIESEKNIINDNKQNTPIIDIDIDEVKRR